VTDGSWRSTRPPGDNWHNRPLADRTGGLRRVRRLRQQPWGKVKGRETLPAATPYLRTLRSGREDGKAGHALATRASIFDHDL